MSSGSGIPTHILKFGGSALADGRGVRRVAEIISARWRGAPRERTVVVVSAHQGVTDLLEGAAWAAAKGDVDAARVRVRHRALLADLGLPGDLLDRYWRDWGHLLQALAHKGGLSAAEMDLALSFGERLSARIVARVCSNLGVPAVPVDAWDLGLISDSRHGSARPLEGSAQALRAGLEELGGVPIVTGFLAKDQRGNLTTLGRNGSDLTASLIAVAFGAEEIQFWKTVSGIMTADPTLVPEARLLDRISYTAAAELAFHGAQVLHPAAVMPALRETTKVTVRDVGDPNGPGTLLTLEEEHAGPVGVAARCSLQGPLQGPPQGPESGPELGQKPPGESASVALVGQAVGDDAALGRQALEALDAAQVQVQHAFQGARPTSQSFTIAAADLQSAARALHGLVLAQPMWTETARPQ